MDTSGIPKSFWHSVSFCLVIATLGLLYIAYSATSVSIQFADTKIELTSLLAEAKTVSGTLNEKEVKLDSFRKDLIDQYETLAVKEPTREEEKRDVRVPTLLREASKPTFKLDPDILTLAPKPIKPGVKILELEESPAQASALNQKIDMLQKRLNSIE